LPVGLARPNPFCGSECFGCLAVWNAFFLLQEKNVLLPVGAQEIQKTLSRDGGGKTSTPNLISENRSRMKIMLIDPHKDLPVRVIKKILAEAIELYASGMNMP
jgi:hypothetical protein